MTESCWICGDRADSSEHKIKKTDLIRIHGSGSDFRASKVYYLNSHGNVVSLQGPDSSRVKYRKIICSKCNNEKTQKADRAYDKFLQYVSEHKAQVVQNKYILLQNIFGNSFFEDSRELFRYFTKAIGCRIADAGERVPDDLSSVMTDDFFQTALWMCVAVNEDELTSARSNRLAIGNLVCIRSQANPDKFAFAYFCEWLVFTLWYGLPPLGPVGGRWAADSDALCLGSYTRAASTFDIPSSNGSVLRWPGFES